MIENKEIWKQIVGYEGLYEISSFGRVKSCDKIDARGTLRKEKILKIYSNSDNFIIACLYKDKKSRLFTVHRILATHFINNPENKKQVKFIDNNKSHIDIDNLEWCHPKDNNNNKCWCEGLTKETDARIRKYSKALKGRKFSEEHKNNISKSRKGKPLSEKQMKSILKAGKIGIAKIAEFRKGKNLEEIYGKEKADNIKKKHVRSMMNNFKNGRCTNTKIEISMRDELIKRCINFDQQYALHRYSCDFAIPENKLIIECDGDYWHANPSKYSPEDTIIRGKGTAKDIWANDRKRDAYIEDLGWSVLRFWETDIKKDVGKCVDKIETFIKLKNLGSIQ